MFRVIRIYGYKMDFRGVGQGAGSAGGQSGDAARELG